jgi:hypothetical protein
MMRRIKTAPKRKCGVLPVSSNKRRGRRDAALSFSNSGLDGVGIFTLRPL